MVEKNNSQNKYNDQEQNAIENRVNESYDQMIQDVKEMVKDHHQYS
ncbi:hypothetical protein ACQYAD_14710 [Neobacillus sp. SM06]